MVTKKLSIVKLSVLAGLVTGFVVLSCASYAQKTYYSRWPDPTGKYQITNASGCGAPAIQDAVGMADNDENTVAYFAANISAPYNCSIKYSFDTYLNLPVDSPYLSTGNNAGWHISVPTGTNIQDLGQNLTISTYLDGVLQESKTGSSLLGIDAGQNGISWFIYFPTSLPFNIVELVVDPKIIKLNTNFQFNVLNAFGGAVSTALPAQIANFNAAVSGKNVDLSWQSLTETNVSAYRIERSSNGGASYSSVASIAAKGNSNVAVNYAYKDAVSVDGNYLYRIMVVNNDGTSKATGSVAAIISGQSKLLIYPTVVKAGQNINIRTSENGMTTVYVYDAQGRLAKQQRTNSSGQFSIATAGLATGVYTIKVISVSGATSQSRIVVN